MEAAAYFHAATSSVKLKRTLQHLTPVAFATSASERPRRSTFCYATGRRAALAIICFYALPVFASDTPVDRVKAYIAAFNSDSGMQEVSAEHWFSKMVLNPEQQHPTHLSGSALAQQFELLRTQLRRAGWLRSEIRRVSYCQLREDFALVSVIYVRIFQDGSERPGAVLYTVGKDSSVWKISSINPIDGGMIISCSGDDA